MQVRKASKADWQLIQKICRETWLTTYKDIYSSSYIERVFDFLLNGTAIGWQKEMGRCLVVLVVE